MSTGVPYGVDLRISGATSTRQDKKKAQGGDVAGANNMSITTNPKPTHDSHGKQGVSTDCWLPVATGAGKDTFHAPENYSHVLCRRCAGLAGNNATFFFSLVERRSEQPTQRNATQRNATAHRQENSQNFRRTPCRAWRIVRLSVMSTHLCAYALQPLISSHLTSGCAALGLEQLRASIVLLGKAEVGDLEVGVVLLVHQEQVLRLREK